MLPGSEREINMDPVTLTAFLAPYLVKAGKSLMDKASDELPGAVGKLWDSLKAKMESRPESASLPADLAKTPEDVPTQGAFQYQLKKILSEDPEFSEKLTKLLDEAKSQTGINVGEGAVAMNGGVANVFKAGGDMSGNTFNLNNTTQTNDKTTRSKK